MPTSTTLLRAAAFAAALAAPLAVAGLPAPALAQGVRGHGDPSAEAFVQNEASRIIGVLNSGMAPGQKKQAFRAEIDRVVDVPRVTRFVLGKYARSASPQQYDAFSAAFREFATRVYEVRLNRYGGQRLTVTGSIVRSPGDVLVSSQVVGGERPTVVMWRVLRSGAGWRAVDVQVAGIWLAVTQQQDIVSTLDNNGGNFDALVAQLRSQNAGAPRS